MVFPHGAYDKGHTTAVAAVQNAAQLVIVFEKAVCLIDEQGRRCRVDSPEDRCWGDI